MRFSLVVLAALSQVVISSPISNSNHTTRANVNIKEALEAIHAPALKWHPCLHRNDQGDDPGECADLTVPLDWTKPQSNQTLIVVVSRIPCRNSSKRVGSLFFNPGGPKSALDFGYGLSVHLLEYFDILGMDLRGFGESDQLECEALPWQCFRWPESPAQLESDNKCISDYMQRCSQNSTLIKYMDTISIARDVEALRVGLGEESLSYFGASYGTSLGTTYLELFPNTLRAMLLDGVYDHTVNSFELLKAQAAAIESEFNRFELWCQSETDCVFRGQDVRQVADRAVKDAGQQSGDLSKCLSYQLENGNYTRVAEMLQHAQNNTLDFITSENCASEEEEPDHTELATLTIDCHDQPAANHTFEDFARLQDELDEIAPIFHNMSTWGAMYASCAGYPFVNRNPPHRLQLPDTLTPVLVVNSLHDIVTPYSSAKNVQSQIPGAVLLTSQKTGHCVYTGNGDEASNIEENFLITGKLPEPGTVVQS